MTDFIVIAVVGLLIGLDVRYICKQRKKGVVCIGCSSRGCCHGNCGQCGSDCSAK